MLGRRTGSRGRGREGFVEDGCKVGIESFDRTYDGSIQDVVEDDCPSAPPLLATRTSPPLDGLQRVLIQHLIPCSLRPLLRFTRARPFTRIVHTQLIAQSFC